MALAEQAREGGKMASDQVLTTQQPRFEAASILRIAGAMQSFRRSHVLLGSEDVDSTSRGLKSWMCCSTTSSQESAHVSRPDLFCGPLGS